MGRFQKKSARAADVAAWYNINPFNLSTLELSLLYSHLPRIKAQRELYQRSINSELTWEHTYDIVLAATGDVERAIKEATAVMSKQYIGI